jgi:lycopene cyclase domain-containing protein
VSYLYLLLDIGSMLVPFLFSFYPKAPFYKNWKYLWISTGITAFLFLVWDEWFTQMGVWGFNPEYVTGMYLGKLPLEEVLFFICIPYACVFTYDALNYLVKKDRLAPYSQGISIFLMGFLLIVGVMNLDKWYTSVTFIATALFLVFITWVWKPAFMGRFYFAFIIILIPFFLVNGVLTGSWIEGEVVWYNNTENLAIRMGTIPFEDTFYGMLMILMNISILEALRNKHPTKQLA